MYSKVTALSGARVLYIAVSGEASEKDGTGRDGTGEGGREKEEREREREREREERRELGWVRWDIVSGVGPLEKENGFYNTFTYYTYNITVYSILLLCNTYMVRSHGPGSRMGRSPSGGCGMWVGGYTV